MSDGHGIDERDLDAARADPAQVESYIVRLLDECREEIKLSDSKASIIFAAVGFSTALLVDKVFKADSHLRTHGAFVVVVSSVAIVALVMSMVMLGMAVLPRVGHPEAGKARYFEEHAMFSSSAALLAVVTRDAEQPSERHAQQLLTLAHIAKRKYQCLRRGMYAVAAAMATLGLALLVAAIN